MGKHGSDAIKIEVDNSGGDPIDLSDYIDTINEFDIEALIQESTAFGDSWMEHLSTGIKQANPVTLEGFYDDTSTTGPDAILNAVGDTRELTITWDGASESDTVDALITNYARIPVAGELTRFRAVLTPTGAVT